MNKLTSQERAQILHLLCEGNSIRAVTRLTGSSKNTVTRLLTEAGQACMEYHDAHVRGLKSKRIQCDEIWSFVYSKAKNVPEGKKGQAGDVWTWTTLDSDSKLICNWFIGSRDAQSALALMDDLKSRLSNRVQLTTDGHHAYLGAVEEAFGEDVDYAMLIKIYGETVEGQKRYSPAECVGTKKTKIKGRPDLCCVSTSHVERSNLTMRMHMRRFTRLTNAFSKKIENHAHAVALHFMYYNFVRIHQTLRVTPAMAAQVTDRLWDIQDIVKVLEAWEAKQKAA